MRTQLLISLVLSSLLILSISCFAKGKDSVITLGMLDPSLKSLEGNVTFDAFLLEENQIEFEKPGVGKYDTFFQEVALITGWLTEARFLLTQINEGKLTLQDAVVNQTLITIQKALNDFEDKIPSVTETAKSFNPKDDFTGFNKRKVPGVSTAIAKAVENLKKAAEEAPQILEQLNTLLTPAESGE